MSTEGPGRGAERSPRSDSPAEFSAGGDSPPEFSADGDSPPEFSAGGDSPPEFSAGGDSPPEFSAGGVVVRDGEVITIVPVKRAADGRRVLGLPKGHPDGDETPEQAAIREVAEETGVQAELVEELGDVEYRYERRGRRIRKVVRFFLFDYRSGDLADHDHEIEEARWMTLADAARELTYEAERAIVHRALSRGAAER